MQAIGIELSKQHYSTQLILELIRFVKEDYPRVDINEICREVGLPYDYLTDENNWVPVKVMRKFATLCIEKTGCKELPFIVGQRSITNPIQGKKMDFLFKHALPIGFLYNHIHRFSFLFVKVTTTKVINRTSNFLRVRLSTLVSGLDEEERAELKAFLPLTLQNAQGTYSAFPTCRGYPPASVKYEEFEDENGMPYYEFTIRYQGSEVVYNALALLKEPLLGVAATLAGQTIFQFSVNTTLFVAGCLTLILWLRAHLKKTNEVRDLFMQSLHSISEADKKYDDLQKSKEEMAQLSQAYKRFVPWEFVSLLKAKDITEIKFGDHVSLRMTVLFLDIRGFTAMTENLTPDEVWEFVNSFYGEMAPLVRSHGGFIDKYSGDGIMAIFPKEPDAALKAAIDITNHLASLNETRLGKGLPKLRIGIGITTGPMILGTVGYQEQMSGTVTAADVNVAARLEQLTKELDCEIIASEATIDGIHDRSFFRTRKLGNILLPGKSTPVSVAEVYIQESDDPLLEDQRIQFEEAVSHFISRDYSRAKQIFNDLMAVNPDDKAVRYYLNLIASNAGIEPYPPQKQAKS